MSHRALFAVSHGALLTGPWLWRLGIPLGITLIVTTRMVCTASFESKEGSDGHEAWWQVAAVVSHSVVELALIIVSAAAIAYAIETQLKLCEEKHILTCFSILFSRF